MGFEIHKQKSIEDILNPSPENFLEKHPRALRKLKNALRKIGFRFKGRFIVDLTIPNYVGGYYAEQINTIAINPFLLLYGSEKDIAHVLFHEGLHAGIYTESKVDDEALVESMTKRRMKEIYGGGEMKTGYDELVDDFNKYFGDLSFGDLSEMIEGGDDETFDNLLEVMVVNPEIKNGDIDSLSFLEIKKKLANVWSVLQKLFPRMMNSISNRNVGPHSGTNVELHHFKFDSLLDKTARQVIGENQELLDEIFETICIDNKEYTKEEVVDQMFKLGLGYLFDYERDFIEEKISEFIKQKSFKSFCKNFKIEELNLHI